MMTIKNAPSKKVIIKKTLKPMPIFLKKIIKNVKGKINDKMASKVIVKKSK